MEQRKYISVIGNSLKATFQGRIVRWLLGSFSTSLAIFVVGKSAFDLTIEKSALVGGCCLFALFFLRFFFILLTKTSQYLQFKWRESIYGDAIILLKDAFAEIHNLRKNEFNSAEFMAVMIRTCEKLKVIFDKQTKSNCSVSIKVGLARVVDANATVKNLCRDVNAASRDTEKYIRTKHTVIGNTPFQFIVNSILTQKDRKDKTFYLNNDINAHQDYCNTSRQSYTSGVLPYKCEIVVPIIPLTREIPNNYDLLGFICVDCNVAHKFIDKEYSSAILEGVADGLYDIIDKFIKQEEYANSHLKAAQAG